MTMVPIFVSSTFRDFHQERDALHQQVRPMLDAALSDLGVSVALVDLRWGIALDASDSERSRAKTILTVCAREIDRCQPFVIGLLGDYYGWTPGEKYVRRFMPGWSAAPADRSITDLELRYAIAVGTSPPIVFRRGVTNAKSAWTDRGEGRLDDLIELCRAKSEFYEYEAATSETGALDLSEFVGVAVPVIERHVRAEFGRRSRGVAVERERRQSQAARPLEGRDRERAALSAELEGVGRVVVSGESGVGKSALVEVVARGFAAMGWTVISHRVTPARPTESDLVRTLAAAIGEAAPNGDSVVAIRSMSRRLGELGRTLVVIDAVEHFTPGPEHDRLRAVLRLPPSVAVVVTTTERAQAENLGRAGFTDLSIGLISPAGVARAVTSTLARVGRQLPDPALACLAASPRSGLWLRLATDLMLTLGEETYVRAAAHEYPDAGLHEELTARAAALPDADGSLVESILQRAEDQFGSGIVASVLSTVITSTGGAVEVDRLGEILGIDAVTITELRYSLGSAIFDTDVRSFATLRHDIVERAARLRYLRDPSAVHERLRHYYSERVRDDRSTVPALIHHGLNCSAWTDVEFALELSPSLTANEVDAARSAVLEFMTAAPEDTRAEWFAAVAATRSQFVVEQLAEVVADFESRRATVDLYKRLGDSLLASPAYAALLADHSEPSAVDLLIAASRASASAGDRDAAIDHASNAAQAAGAHRRLVRTPEAEARTATALQLYVRSFLGYFGATMGKHHCSDLAQILGDTEKHVRALGSSNRGAILADTLSARLLVCGRCPESTALGDRVGAFHELVALRRAQLDAEPGEESTYRLASALLHAADAFADRTARVPHLREADRLLEGLVRSDSGSIRYVLALARAKHARFIALSADIHNDAEMRVAAREAANLLESVVRSDLRSAHDLEAIIHVLTETGAAQLLYRRTDRRYWQADVEDGIASFQRALNYAEHPTTPERLRRGAGHLVCAQFPKQLDDATSDLKFSAKKWMRRFYSLNPSVDFDRITTHHNLLLDIWTRAAKLTERDPPELSRYEFIGGRDVLERVSREIMAAHEKRRREFEGSRV
jgi:hypothetical protein